MCVRRNNLRPLRSTNITSVTCNNITEDILEQIHLKPLLIANAHYKKNTPVQIYWKFRHQNWKFSDKNSDIFSYFCSKHRLWVLEAVLTSTNKIKKIIYTPCKPQFYYIKWGFRGQNYICMFSWCFSQIIINVLLYTMRETMKGHNSRKGPVLDQYMHLNSVITALV